MKKSSREVLDGLGSTPVHTSWLGKLSGVQMRIPSDVFELKSTIE